MQKPLTECQVSGQALQSESKNPLNLKQPFEGKKEKNPSLSVALV